MDAELRESLLQLFKFQTEQSLALQKQQLQRQLESEEKFKKEFLEQQNSQRKKEERFEERLLQQQKRVEEIFMKTQEEQRKLLEATQ